MSRPAVTRVAILEDAVTHLARRGAQGDLDAALLGLRTSAVLARARKELQSDAWGIVRPVAACGFVNPHDGLCTNPDNLTPECHGRACPLVSSRGPSRPVPCEGLCDLQVCQNSYTCCFPVKQAP